MARVEISPVRYRFLRLETEGGQSRDIAKGITTNTNGQPTQLVDRFNQFGFCKCALSLMMALVWIWQTRDSVTFSSSPISFIVSSS